MPAPQSLAAAVQFVLHGEYNVTIALATFGDGEDAPTYRRLNVSNEIGDEFRALAREWGNKLRRLQASGDAVMNEYDPNYAYEKHHLPYVEADDDEIGDTIRVPPPSQIALLGDVDGFVDHVRFYALILSTQGQRVVLYRRYSKNMELVRSDKLIARWIGDRLDAVHEPIFQFDRKVDAIAYRNHVFVLNSENFQHIFRYYEALQQTANATLQTIGDAVAIANFDDFRTSCLGHLHKLKKLRSIASKPYLNQITVADLQATINRFHLPVQIDAQDRLIFDPQHRWEILHLLDDAYLESRMTGLLYEANSKREREV
jgi:hypothetical protein